MKVAAIGSWVDRCCVGGFVDPLVGGDDRGGIDAGSMSAPRALGKPSGGGSKPTYTAELEAR